MAKRPKEKELTLDFFRKQGEIGGKMGGSLAWANLTPEERSERARKAVAARKWHPVKPPEKPKRPRKKKD